MKRYITLPVWLWIVQAATGLLLVLYVVIHTIDNAMILLSDKAYEDMLALWHETLPHWFYILMVIGLIGLFILHAANGIRIASKPYKDIDVSWRHNVMMKHSGTWFWYTQVLTGSGIAMFAVWHLIVQHGTVATTTAAQSMLRVSPTVFIIYVIFLAAIMFHSFNGVRSVIIKLGFMTDKAREGVLIGILAILFVVFFLTGALSIAKFIPSPAFEQPNYIENSAVHNTVDTEIPIEVGGPANVEGSPELNVGDNTREVDGSDENVDGSGTNVNRHNGDAGSGS